MERMSYPTYSEIKKLDKKLYNKRMEVYDRVYVLEEEIKELEEENKKLKDDLRIAQGLVEKYEEIELKMGKENKNLKLIQETNENQLKNDIKERDRLRDELKELKSDLDKYKKYYDRDKEELMEICYGLARENDELKKQIENLNGIAKMVI